MRVSLSSSLCSPSPSSLLFSRSNTLSLIPSPSPSPSQSAIEPFSQEMLMRDSDARLGCATRMRDSDARLGPLAFLFLSLPGRRTEYSPARIQVDSESALCSRPGTCPSRVPRGLAGRPAGPGRPAAAGHLRGTGRRAPPAQIRRSAAAPARSCRHRSRARRHGAPPHARQPAGPGSLAMPDACPGPPPDPGRRTRKTR